MRTNERPSLRQKRGRAAHRRGHISEYYALFWLLLKGYRILGFRLKTPEAEIDIVALKNNDLCIIEVKQRSSHDQALMAVSKAQLHRLWQAGQKLKSRRNDLKLLNLRLDLITVSGIWPRHYKNAFEGGSDF